MIVCENRLPAAISRLICIFEKAAKLLQIRGGILWVKYSCAKSALLDIQGSLVRASESEALCCVIEQDTLSPAHSSGSTQEDPPRHD